MKLQQQYQVYTGREQLEIAAAKRWVELAGESLRARNSFHVALAGGATPEPVYRLLQHENLDWERIHLYWGDERDVPADHPESNFRMVKQALIDHVPIPATNVHPIQVQADIEQSVQAYREVLMNVHHAGKGIPCFDLIMLGVGDDGHIASLFPESSALTVNDTPVVSVYVEKLSSWRVTLTYPVLDAARNLMLLVAGEAKAPVVASVLGGADSEQKYPVQKLSPQGRVEWYLDTAAASSMPAST
ncbi:MAG: 6-phosphogluconolactonase [Pseudohongiellaceae bacterium]